MTAVTQLQTILDEHTAAHEALTVTLENAKEAFDDARAALVEAQTAMDDSASEKSGLMLGIAQLELISNG